MTVAVFGILLGVSLSWLTADAVQPLLFRQSAREAFVLAGVALVLLAAALTAGIPPSPAPSASTRQKL